MNKVKTLYNNEWLSLKEIDGYVYSHEKRCDGKVVAILVVDSKDHKGEVLGRFEKVPAHFDEVSACSITGGYEHGDKPVDTAIRELLEEAGYEATRDEMISLGTVRPTKSCDTITHLFAVDVAGKKQTKPEGDGSDGEKDAYVEWISVKDGVACKDPLVSTMIIRYNYKKGEI